MQELIFPAIWVVGAIGALAPGLIAETWPQRARAADELARSAGEPGRARR